jgi:hypothetical protein
MRTLFVATAAFAALVMVAPIGNAHAQVVTGSSCVAGDICANSPAPHPGNDMANVSVPTSAEITQRNAAAVTRADNTPCPADGKHAYGMTCAQVRAQDAANAYITSPAGQAAQAQAAAQLQHCITAEGDFVKAYAKEFSAAQSPTNIWIDKRYSRVVGSLSAVITKKSMELSAGGAPIDCDATYAELLDYVLHGSNE